jgi:hypothetical protein
VPVGRTLYIVAASLALAATTCHRGPAPPEPGHAFAEAVPSWAGLDPVKPGTQWILLFAFLRNDSSEPATLRGVKLSGKGLGDVVEMIGAEAAPLPPLVDERSYTPGGIYVTDPPAINLFDDACNKQTLLPLKGFLVPPGGELRLAIFLRAVAPGSYNLRRHIVEYEQSSQRFVQEMAVGTRGAVSSDGRPVPLEPAQRKCLDAGRLLSGSAGI